MGKMLVIMLSWILGLIAGLSFNLVLNKRNL